MKRSEEKRREEKRGQDASERVDRRVGTKATHNCYSPAGSPGCDLPWLIIPRTENGNWPGESRNLMLGGEPRAFRR